MSKSKKRRLRKPSKKPTARREYRAQYYARQDLCLVKSIVQVRDYLWFTSSGGRA